MLRTINRQRKLLTSSLTANHYIEGFIVKLEIYNMKKLNLILHLLALLLFATSCGKQDPPQEELLYEIELLYQPHPDSAMLILDTLNVSVLSEKERAHYCLLRARTNQISLKFNAETDSLLNEAENYYANSNEYYFTALTYWTQALEAGLTRKSSDVLLDYKQKALQSIEKCKRVDKRINPNNIKTLKYNIYFRLGLQYCDSHHYREGLEHLRKAERFFDETDDYNYHALTTITMGLAFLRCHQHDSSLYYFDKGLVSAEKTGDKAMLAQYYQSVSQYYIYRYDRGLYKDENEGIALLRKSISLDNQCLALLDETDDRHRKKLYGDVACYDLAQVYYKLGEYDTTIFYASKITSDPDACFYLFKSYSAIGDRENAMVYAEKYMNKMQNIDNTQLAFDEIKEEYDLQMQQQRLESEHHVKRLRLYLLITALLIVLLVLWISITRYRKNKEIEVLEIKNSQYQTLIQSVATIYKNKRDNRLQQIIRQFNSTYPEALNDLNATYPELNDTEQKIIVLSFLGFRIKEEADLLGLSENTIRQYRSNANKKAGSNPISDII